MVFDMEKIKQIYEELKAEKEQKIQEALYNKEAIVAEKLEVVKAEIEANVEAEIVAEVSAKYNDKIELLERALIEEVVVNEEVVEQQ